MMSENIELFVRKRNFRFVSIGITINRSGILLMVAFTLCHVVLLVSLSLYGIQFRFYSSNCGCRILHGSLSASVIAFRSFRLIIYDYYQYNLPHSVEHLQNSFSQGERSQTCLQQYTASMWVAACYVRYLHIC